MVKRASSTRETLSTARQLGLVTANSLSVAFETNNRGFLGFIVELPGAYVRGFTAEDAVAKAPMEAAAYLRWLGQEHAQFSKASVVQTHQCTLMVEDADCEILLADDSRPMSDQEFRKLVNLVKYSGTTFTKLYDSAELKGWVDEARIRPTFWGQNPKTIQEIFDHVRLTQYYYLSRARLSIPREEKASFMRTRDSSLNGLEGRFRESANARVYTADNEDWTLKKILRRFIWHDRIHGKAITRILEKQRQLGLIGRYEDPFRFNLSFR